MKLVCLVRVPPQSTHYANYKLKKKNSVALCSISVNNSKNDYECEPENLQQIPFKQGALESISFTHFSTYR